MSKNGIPVDRKSDLKKPPEVFETQVPAPSALVGSRHIVTLMLFFGMANAYVMRTNMSVAIVAMVNHTSITESKEPVVNECGHDGNASNDSSTLANHDGEFHWDSTMQGYLLSSFFYGYVITQIPFGILAKRYGSKYFLGIGMLINSMFGLLVPVSARAGYHWLMIVRFIQGLGEEWIIPIAGSYCALHTRDAGQVDTA